MKTTGFFFCATFSLFFNSSISLFKSEISLSRALLICLSVTFLVCKSASVAGFTAAKREFVYSRYMQYYNVIIKLFSTASLPAGVLLVSFCGCVASGSFQHRHFWDFHDQCLFRHQNFVPWRLLCKCRHLYSFWTMGYAIPRGYAYE